MKKNLQYASYLLRHKWFVLVAGLKTGATLRRLLVHDFSKFSKEEWGPYREFFYGPQPPTAATKNAFMAAWRHHVKVNDHHWEYWLDANSSLPRHMPMHAVREMVADWAGAGRAITGRWDVCNWYEDHRKKIVLDPDSRRMVELYLERFRPLLESIA